MLPFLLAYILIGGFVDLIVLLTQPLEDVLPHLGLMSPTARHFAVLGLLFSIFVVVKDTKLAQRMGAWIEREFFFKLPPYRLVREITRRLAGEPLTSLPTMGTLHIVSEAKVERLDAAFMDAIGWYFNWGADTHAVLSGRADRR